MGDYLSDVPPSDRELDAWDEILRLEALDERGYFDRDDECPGCGAPAGQHWRFCTMAPSPS